MYERRHCITDFYGGRQVHPGEIPGMVLHRNTRIPPPTRYLEADNDIIVWKKANLETAGIIGWRIQGERELPVTEVLATVTTCRDELVLFSIDDGNKKSHFESYPSYLLTEIKK